MDERYPELLERITIALEEIAKDQKESIKDNL